MNDDLKTKINALLQLSPQQLKDVAHQDFAEIVLDILTMFAGYLRPTQNGYQVISKTDLRIVLNQVTKKTKGFPSFEELLAGIDEISSCPDAANALRTNAKGLLDSLTASDTQLTDDSIEGAYLRLRRAAAEFYTALHKKLSIVPT